MTCPHGGQVQIAPRQEIVLIGGAPALAEGDLVGAPIVNCQVKVTPLTNPCTNIVSEVPAPGVGQSLVARCAGRPLLLEGVTAITNSRPPGVALVVFPGQTIVMA
jgi:hypothetical protein